MSSTLTDSPSHASARTHSGPILVAEGKATTTARFTQPGTYVLRATANDGALSTKSDVAIVVGAAGATPGKH